MEALKTRFYIHNSFFKGICYKGKKKISRLIAFFAGFTGGIKMKIGDIVTRKIYGEDMQFCIIGFYTNQSTGERVAILALLDPSLIVEASVQELAPISARHLFAMTTSLFVH